MALPIPVPGLVISYAYLWRDEALKGREDGGKDRPCVIVLAVTVAEGQTIVTVAPITHSQPTYPEAAVELPAATKVRLGLDGQRSWIIAADLNRFVWPGVDLRPTRRGSQTFSYGLVPAAIYQAVREKVLGLARSGKLRTTSRNE